MGHIKKKIMEAGSNLFLDYWSRGKEVEYEKFGPEESTSSEEMENT